MNYILHISEIYQVASITAASEKKKKRETVLSTEDRLHSQHNITVCGLKSNLAIDSSLSNGRGGEGRLVPECG